MPLVAPALASRSKTSSLVILSLTLVFLCGVTVGAVAAKYTRHVGANSSSKSIPLERWKKELDLTDQQSSQIKDILDDVHKYYDNVLADGRTRILQTLNPDQKQKFQRMLKEIQ